MIITNYYSIRVLISKKKTKTQMNDFKITYREDGEKEYEGEYANGLKNGKGVFYFMNGARYEGEWKDDKKNGKGVYYYAAEPWKGHRYEGEFLDDKKNGKGILFYANGSRYEGEWKNDKKHGKGIFYCADGTKENAEWCNGVFKSKRFCSVS